MIEFKDKVRGKITGRFRLFEVKGGEEVLIHDEKNTIVDYHETIIQGLLARNPEDFMIAAIAIGEGGDAEINEPHNDTGARVATDPIEENMRIPIAEIPIQAVNESGDEIEYSALARPDQAVSDDINEFGLIARNGKLFAHHVPDAAPTRAEKKPKTDIYWILKWTIEYVTA
jgi:hypothetical protein